MARISLRGKILLYSSSLLVALILAMLLFVDFQAKRYADERIAADLEQDRQRIEIMQSERMAGVRLTAQLVASFPELRALLGTDQATIRDFLLAYQQENKWAELLIVLDPAGRVVARTDTVTPVPIAEAETRWVQPALVGQSATGLLATDRAVYQAASVPAAAGGTVFLNSPSAQPAAPQDRTAGPCRSRR